jgi:hypothetical protein
METYGLVDYDGIDINQHEHMKNVVYNLSNHQFYLLISNPKWSMNTTTQPYYHVCSITYFLLELVFMKSYILIHLVCQSVTRLGKGVLCSCELNTVYRQDDGNGF